LPIIAPGCSSSPKTTIHAKINALLKEDDHWFETPAGIEAVNNVVSWQNPNGGWWKKYDASKPRPAVLPPPDMHDAPPGDTEADWRQTSTFDNGATHTELRLLARAYTLTGQDQFKTSFQKGLDFIFRAQYPNGGWPQRYPLENNYGRRITFNDNVMTGILWLLKDIIEANEDFEFLDDANRQRAQTAFTRGIDCILKCQITVDGKLTAWCQQHDETTLQPAGGRTYELPGLSGGESADVLLLLMSLENPDDRTRQSIEAGYAWYQAVKITGKRIKTITGPQFEKGVDRVMVDDPSAPPMWARFYDLSTMKPFVCDRDGIKRDSIDQLSRDRRNGYLWFGHWGSKLERPYRVWKKRVQSAHNTAASVP
jgi:PelA/Pel-15E family pectate lyase